MDKLDDSDTRNCVLRRPLTSKDAKKFKAWGTDVDTIRDGIGNLRAAFGDKEFRIKKVRMVCRMAHKIFIKIE
jgi:hypothetical protein